MIRYEIQQSDTLPSFVSVHGGHSGDYCQHAQDSLDDIVKAYHDLQFAWVGITEHIPPVSDAFLHHRKETSWLPLRKLKSFMFFTELGTSVISRSWMW